MKEKKALRPIIFCILLSFTIFIPPHLSADIDIVSFARRAGGFIEWNPMAGRGTLVKDGERYTFTLHSGSIVYNYTERLPGGVYRGEGGSVYFDETAQKALSERIKLRAEGAPSVAAILIDPGHGGKDPGAIGSHNIDGKELVVREKDIVLDVSKNLYLMLQEQYPDKRIMLTRTGDTYPSLEDRVEIANSVSLADHEAIIYISVHANASLNKKAKGFEVWYLPPDYRRTLIDQESIEDGPEEVLPILNSMLEEEYTTESILLAREILASMDNQIGNETENRGLKEEIWFVVRKAKMPSVLLELGFVTNVDEAQKLSDPDYLQKLSVAIYNGTSKFIENFESTKGFTELE
jgi:N-acetylmuramoyl-L-alanine amidase